MNYLIGLFVRAALSLCHRDAKRGQQWRIRGLNDFGVDGASEDPLEFATAAFLYFGVKDDGQFNGFSDVMIVIDSLLAEELGYVRSKNFERELRRLTSGEMTEDVVIDVLRACYLPPRKTR